MKSRLKVTLAFAAISKLTEKVYNCYASATAVGLSLNLLDYTREFKESVCISSSMTVNDVMTDLEHNSFDFIH
ncbi:MAG: hypothetical protein M3146_08560 [Thermoproteota archaeon]|nr:hypothetical protein [Thermoproteota archaeon]